MSRAESSMLRVRPCLIVATQKVKRRAIASRFEELVEGLYR